jgi:orotidine-5'-phosphate decarboxylase
VSDHFADRLLDATKARGPVCVGLDPLYEELPAELQTGDASPGDRLAAISAFCYEVLGIVAPIVPAVKPQIAFFESLGYLGVKLYFDLVGRARKLGLLVIGDVKRGDIGHTAEAYAAAHLEGEDAPDAVTVNGYFGEEGIVPFLRAAQRLGKGLFVLVRTSNPSAAAIQDFAGPDGRKFYEHMAAQLAAIGEEGALLGHSGYSCLGAVVGATYPQEARRLREIMPRQIFLVPGYGAQGASAADCTAAFKADGTGAIVNASRSVIYAYRKGPHAGREWKAAIAAAAADLVADIRQALKR